jgi:hypothetical protein
MMLKNVDCLFCIPNKLNKIEISLHNFSFIIQGCLFSLSLSTGNWIGHGIAKISTNSFSLAINKTCWLKHIHHFQLIISLSRLPIGICFSVVLYYAELIKTYS